MQSYSFGQRFMALLVLSAVIVFAPVAVRASGSPPWLQAYYDGTLSVPNQYFGIGSAEFKGENADYKIQHLSRDRALDELCCKLSVSIQSQLTDKLSQKGKYGQQEVASSLFVSARKVLTGVREKDKWLDSDHHRYWVMVVIDKASADRQVREQDFINGVVDRLEGHQKEILAGIKTMTAVMRQDMEIYQHRMDGFDRLLSTINDKVGAAGAQTRTEYGAIQNSIANMQKQYQKQQALLAGQNAKLEILLKRNEALAAMFSRVSEHIAGDPFLALSEDDVANKRVNPNFTVHITPLKGQGADYYKGQRIRFRVTANRDCFIKVIYLSSIGEGQNKETRINTLLFPNTHERDNHIQANVPTLIGGGGELIIQPPYGKDIVTVVASRTQFDDIAELLAKAQGRYYSEVTTTTRGLLEVRVRGIGVMENSTGIPSGDKGVVTDTCFIVSHGK